MVRYSLKDYEKIDKDICLFYLFLEGEGNFFPGCSSQTTKMNYVASVSYNSMYSNQDVCLVLMH